MTSGQNRSSAVMQQRAEPPDSFDDFPTHPWATRALMRELRRMGFRLQDLSVWEPCCNRGFMVKPLREEFGHVIATDVFDYGYPASEGTFDFLGPWDPDLALDDVDFVITNPPFNLGWQIILRALSIARVGVAVFVRNAFDEGEARYRNLFQSQPETYAMPFVQRVPLHRGKLRHPRRKYFDPSADGGKGKWKLPSTATAYSWKVWLRGHNGLPQLIRIAPCRDALMREDDYPIRYRDEFGPGSPNGEAGLFDDLPSLGESKNSGGAL